MKFQGVYSVIVTYGNRHHYLSKTIEAGINAGVDKLIIVNNGSNRRLLQATEKKYSGRIIVHNFDLNLGSATGYKKGLEICQNDSRCEFIWLLDDDNQPELKSLEELLLFWNNYNFKNKNLKLALSSFRKDREIYKNAVLQNNPKLMLGIPNSFSGFHFKRLYEILLKKLGYSKNTKTKLTSGVFGKIYVAPYGGLFFNKDLIQRIGLPDETYYVYADDYDYTSRISEFGGEIILVINSKINDLERSFIGDKRFFTSKMINASTPNKCYYMFRNSVIFEAKNVNRKFIYFTNMILYVIFNTALLAFNTNTHSLLNYKAFLKGISEGLRR